MKHAATGSRWRLKVAMTGFILFFGAFAFCVGARAQQEKTFNTLKSHALFLEKGHDRYAAFADKDIQIVKVSNLNRRGEGSLAAAVNREGPRIVVFEVGGVIDLAQSGIDIRIPYLYIAGQTAPAPGITLIRGGVNIYTHDVLIQHIHIRPGDCDLPARSGWEEDGMCTYGAYNIVVDHCSFTWATDENLSASGPRYDSPDRTSRNITFSNNIISECLYESTHGKTVHSMGTLIHDYCRNIAIVGNLYAHNNQRNPMLKPNVSAYIANNVIYNSKDQSIHATWPVREYAAFPDSMRRAEIVAVGNVLIPGADTKKNMYLLYGNLLAWHKDNHIYRSAVDPKSKYNREYVVSPEVESLAQPPLHPVGYTPLPADRTVAHVLENAGARPKERDPIDQRIVRDLKSGKGKLLNSQNEVGGYPDYPPVYRPLSVPENNIEEWLDTFSGQGMAAASSATSSATSSAASSAASPESIGRQLSERFLQVDKHVLWRGKYINYQEVCLWIGALRFAHITGNKDLVKRLQDRFEPFFSTEKDLLPVPENVDLTVFGALALELYHITKEQRYFELGISYADAQWTLPAKATAEQKAWADKGLSRQTRMWIDDMYMITVLQAQAYRATGKQEYIDRAAKEMAVYLDSLQRPNGLFYHAPDVPFFWGRGNGWMAAGMTELLNVLPAGNPDRPRILKGYLAMMESLKSHQTSSGMWNQLVDDPACWPETSASAMFAYALLDGIRSGRLEASSYAPAARKAWSALLRYINPEGDMTEVCAGTNKYNDRQYYYDRKRETGDYHGQAPMLWCACALLQPSPASPQTGKSGVWDVFDYGAKGDGQTMDTHAIQAAIDRCHLAGGGRVYLHGGRFLSGTIYLKSNVSLHIENGATLLGSKHQQDYPVRPSKLPSYHGTYLTNRMLVYAEDADNISISGDGTIDGNGEDFFGIDQLEALTERPRIIHLRGCRNIRIQNITLRNSASWVQSYMSCENLLIDGITVDSRENRDIRKARFADAPGRNTDGLDIVDCRNVRIAHCFINSGDDGICLKSLSRKEACRNIVITNCVITTNASGIKIGTESVGGFQDIVISNCTIYDTRLGGVDVMCVDGATVERILVSGITLRNINGAALFVRLGKRGRMHRADETPGAGSIRDISFRDIYGTGIERYGCSITGVPGAPVENILLDNINLTFKGGTGPLLFQGEAGHPVKELSADSVPEAEKKHPRSDMFGKLPAYGFYVRHANKVTFSNIRLDTEEEDKRPALIFDDVKGLTVHNSKNAYIWQKELRE
jgi:polygalacturonase/rhamnogalacturonyl hydrolase YesR